MLLADQVEDGYLVAVQHPFSLRTFPVTLILCRFEYDTVINASTLQLPTSSLFFGELNKALGIWHERRVHTSTKLLAPAPQYDFRLKRS